MLFLYTEISGYFLAGLKALWRDHGVESHVVRWPVNAEAPFKFGELDGITLYDRNQFDHQSLKDLFETLKPVAVFTSGWVDKGYNKLATQIDKNQIPVICSMDNQWRGDLRQWVATLVSPWMVLSRFSHCWIPGLYQYEFARRLGFPRKKILTGMYCCDQQKFAQAYKTYLQSKQETFPHTFFYVGRFSPEKGTVELYRAFTELSNELTHDWKLVFVGDGPLKSELKPHPAVEVRGFVQPDELPKIVEEAGALVFPSNRDAWGVSIHEFAAAGLPLVVTRAAGAVPTLLREGYNGYGFDPGDISGLQSALKRIMAHPDPELLNMGQRSHQLSFQITPESWAATLMSVVDEYRD